MANEHPFQALFETFGRLPTSHAESINRRAYELLWSALAVNTDHPGRCILLKAPRAGHGKTHLLSRLQHHLGNDHEFIPLYAASGSFIDAASVTSDTLSRLSRALPAGGGLCVLDLLVRRLFALALQPLVRSGEVPCQDREGALAALRNRPVETFDFHHPNAVTAHWARENFEVLGPRLALELAQRTGAPLREVMFWIDAFFRFAATPVDHPSRAGSLIQAVVATPAQPAQAFERLSALLSLLTQLIRVVLVADDLEGFSSDEGAALQFASFLGSLRHSADRVDTILSVNRDIWESAFLPRLSGGLADRLSEIVIELEPLTRDEMVALLEARATGLGERIFGRLDLSNGERHARGILRAAANAWAKASVPTASLPAEIAQEAAPIPSFSPAPATVAAAISAAELAPELPAEVPVIESSPFLSVAQPAPPQITEQPAISQPAFQAEPPIVPEPVAMQEPEPVVDFLPPVEPVSEPQAVVIPSLFEPAQPASQPAPDFPAPEVVPVGRIITDEELLTAVTVTDVPEASIAPPPLFQPEPVSHAEPEIQQQPVVPSPSVDFGQVSTSFQAQTFDQPQSVEPPVGSFQPPTTGSIQAAIQPAAPAFSTPPAAAEEPKETDRVDELLRQFRERYARG